MLLSHLSPFYLTPVSLFDKEKLVPNIGIKKVVFNNPATIVFWDDGTKTVVKCGEGDKFNEELGLAMCCAKKLLGNKSNFNNKFKKFLSKEEN